MLFNYIDIQAPGLIDERNYIFPNIFLQNENDAMQFDFFATGYDRSTLAATRDALPRGRLTGSSYLTSFILASTDIYRECGKSELGMPCALLQGEAPRSINQA